MDSDKLACEVCVELCRATDALRNAIHLIQSNQGLSVVCELEKTNLFSIQEQLQNVRIKIINT